MAWGEHYVYCGVCGCKIYNTEAVHDEEDKWVCKDHVLHDLFDRSKQQKEITPVYPSLRRKPLKDPVFRDEALYWEKIGEVWETIEDTWETK